MDSTEQLLKDALDAAQAEVARCRAALRAYRGVDADTETKQRAPRTSWQKTAEKIIPVVRDNSPVRLSELAAKLSFNESSLRNAALKSSRLKVEVLPGRRTMVSYVPTTIRPGEEVQAETKPSVGSS